MSAQVPVAVLGARGRMGSAAVTALKEAENTRVVATLGRGDPLEAILESGARVAVELTVPSSTADNVTWLVEHGISVVVGTTGWDEERLDRLRGVLANHPEVAVLIAPNFSISAILAMQFSRLAAPFFTSAEVVETHHPRKLDAPSGTAIHTAEGIAAARREAGLEAMPDATENDPQGARGAVIEGVHVHAIRQQGMNAHEEIHFGSHGESLTIRTDTYSVQAFMPGIIRAVQEIPHRSGLTIGLENYLGLSFSA